MNYTDSNLEKVTYESSVNLENLNLKIYTGAQFGLEINNIFGSHLHRHLYYEIFYVKSGEITIQFEDKDVTIKENDIIIIAPTVAHCVISTSADCDVFSFYFSYSKNSLKTEVDMYDMISKFLCDEYIYIKNRPSLTDITEKISREFLTNNHYSSGVYFCELLIDILKISKVGKAKSSKRSISPDSNMNRIRIIDYIINNKFNQDIELDAIAKILCLSKKQTSRIIAKHYGVNFRELIVQMRMIKASELLLETEKSVTAITNELGYSSLKGFYYIFKKYYGILPSEYREKNRL
ncbi:MAG: helix-turn-helix domain-containing protein [Clostridia bacterium]|nr:helix-turn-helix domain-containing protein [Clostridia bacterium]